jgi:hypothetical protein
MAFSKTRHFSSNTLQYQYTMKPKKSPQDQPSTFKLFQSRLDNMINPDHPLVHLAAAIQWERFDEAYAKFYCPDNGAPGLPTRLMVGLQYRGHDYKGSAVIRIAGTSNDGLRWSEKKRKRRRSSIEPVIGHLKSDHRLDRCFLKGRIGDKLNLIGSAAGFNVRKLLRLLGTGIFSRALSFWGGFCRYLSSLSSRFCNFMSA